MPGKTYRTDCPEIATVSLYIPKPLYLHGYVLPFILLYAGWLYVWLTFLGASDHFEAGMLGFAACGVLQILACLFCHWFVSVRCAMTCRAVTDVAQATAVQVIPTANNGYPELVSLRHTKSHEDGRMLHWFMFQKGKFTFDAEEKNMFIGTRFPVDSTIQSYIDSRGFQTEHDLKVGEEKYGKNDIVLDIPKFAELFKERATAPFFVFQVFCVGLWCLDEYWYYSLFTLAMLVVFECTLVQQQLRHISEIRKMGNKPYTLPTYRNKKWSQLRTDELVPGDLLAIARPKSDNLVPCDLLLLRGQVIVDEAMLTGESVPVMKEPADSLAGDHVFDMECDGKLHVLFGGTKIVQHTPPPKASHSGASAAAAGIIRAPDNSCLAMVLRNGFSTSQGRLLKTILYSVKRVTANNLETFLFILFLLVFAVAASAYVWINGTVDARRNRYKLFLECTLILTSVVPPELPIELSLAVNSSLIALSKQLVFCTEPFRIPFAGKIDICCFDKTGTLTRDEMVVEGVAGLDPQNEETVLPVSETPLKTIQVLASCHSLVQLDSDMVGDPLEKAILKATDWTLTRGEAVIPRSVKSHPLKIFHRFHFSSTLRRMSVIAGYTPVGSTDTHYMGAVKGSPEALKKMFVDLPANYDKVYLKMARRGARVLALGYRELGVLSHQQVREMRRETVESELRFIGFVIISCPLKNDSKAAVKEISGASHHVTMITGDNPLTACHVARELRFTSLRHTLILTPANSLDQEWHWQSVDDSICLPWHQNLRALTKKHDLCLTGEGMAFLGEEDKTFLRLVLPAVKVFARVSPKQKEQVLTTLKERGFVTLMCGDGTNDVGALKHAHVGVALLANAPERLTSAKPAESRNAEKDKNAESGPTPNGPSPPRGPGGRRRRVAHGSSLTESNPQSLTPLQQANRRLASAMAELEEEEMNAVVRLGDASIAAPFTCKLSSVYGVCQIIKQGRCTLVTTLQMFKILALNALILAYSQSVLFLDGVKFSDTQATLQGLLLAGCFLFISRSKPLKTLSTQRPLPNIFNLYTLMTVMCQFAVHFAALMTLTSHAKALMPPKKEGESIDLEAKFEPNLLNSVVYLISMGMQITTFSVNYKGHPFMESLFENRPLLYSLAISASAVIALASGIVPDAAKQFEIVPIPEDFRLIILKVIALDFAVSLLIDRILDFLAGKARVRRLVR